MANVKKSVRRAKGKPFVTPLQARREKKIAELKNKTTRVNRARKSPRLYMKAALQGYKRGLTHSNNNIAILRIDNVNTQKDAEFYIGKRVCYVYHGYKVKRCVRFTAVPKRRSNTRAIWGKITRSHGTSGAVRAKFSPNLPGSAVGRRIRVYLYPSRF